MTNTISRRQFAKSTAAAGAGLILGAPHVALAANPTTVRTATLAGGWSNLANYLLAAKGFDKKHGIELDSFRVYNRLGTYYADFVKGAFQMGVGAWDAFAKQHMRGAPMHSIGIISTGTLAGFYAKGNGPNSLEEMRGKTIAAMGASGTFAMAKTWTKVFGNFDMQKDAKLANAPNPPAVITMVAADRADVGVVWEHALSTGLEKIPGSKVFLNVNDFYRKHTGRDQPYFTIGVNSQSMQGMPNDTVKRMVAAWDETFTWIMANPGEFQQLGSRVKINPSVLKAAMDSGRMQWKMRASSDEKNRAEVKFAADIMQKAGTLPKALPDSYFAV